MSARKFTRTVLTLALATGWTAASFGALAAPAQAKDSRVYYRAELVQPVKDDRTEIIRGVMWRCEGDKCIGTKGRSSAVFDCTRFAREFGAVASFTAGDEALSADDLARCNA